MAEELVDDSPQNWLCLYSLGVAQYRAGRFEEATERLCESIAAAPDQLLRPLSYPVLALAYHHQGEAALARQSLNDAAQAIDRWTQARYQGHAEHWVMHRGASAQWPISWWDWLECELFYREAKELIDGLSPPDDARLRVLRARAFAGLRWNAQADEQYAQALRQRPDDPDIRLEAQQNRGYSFVDQRRWHDAAAAFARACELKPDEAYIWRFRAVALLAAGEIDDYRRVCAAMMDRFEDASDAWAACNVVFACVLREDALADMRRLIPLAEAAAPYYHFGARVQGAALYRAGNCAEAVRSFEKASKVCQPSAWEWCFLAMAEQSLAQPNKAQRSLTAAERWIEDANRMGGEDLSGASAAWGGWSDRVTYPLVLQEAEAAVIRGKKQNNERLAPSDKTKNAQ